MHHPPKMKEHRHCHCHCHPHHARTNNDRVATIFVGALFFAVATIPTTTAFPLLPSSNQHPQHLYRQQPYERHPQQQQQHHHQQHPFPTMLGMSSQSSPPAKDSTTGDDTSRKNDTNKGKKEDSDSPPAATSVNTINARLLAELEDASNKEKFGARSGYGKKMGMRERRVEKSPFEQEKAIAEACNLNGVNPAVALTGSAFALTAAAGLWYITNQLAGWFAVHPVTSDVYVVQRTSGVLRNVIMGLSSLASGFFGVTGFGIFLLGMRVLYGVVTGELDPTPLVNNKYSGSSGGGGESPDDTTNPIVLPNAWDLMMGKKRGRRGK